MHHAKLIRITTETVEFSHFWLPVAVPATHSHTKIRRHAVHEGGSSWEPSEPVTWSDATLASLFSSEASSCNAAPDALPDASHGALVVGIEAMASTAALGASLPSSSSYVARIRKTRSTEDGNQDNHKIGHCRSRNWPQELLHRKLDIWGNLAWQSSLTSLITTHGKRLHLESYLRCLRVSLLFS
jgi:hypothetical protein